ncbi:hypothetical protein DM01DRAFT_1379106 [Hesseltinella vesiculosa]|uniref:Reverse transcriptase zinc-binding domain-containing protein n=1 Tax=Hesseltinella vesiculosa TaxID=101127 RepID=A0A1X2G2A3_9FUNG|nr:hypothetical protein DM01DRAFT_1379106 [Hesseltinella vesiculosa]
MAYADDMLVFLSDPSKWDSLQRLYSVYANASNSRLNVQKTELISLSGHPWRQWSSTCQDSGASWHDKHSATVVKYLGYPIYSSKAQLRAFWDVCTINVERQCQALKERRLTIRGTSLLCNSVILASLWHLLRITPIPESWIAPVRSIIRQFVMPFSPAPAWSTATLPRSQGGLGVLDIRTQQIALQIRLAQRVVATTPESNDTLAKLVQGMWLRCFGQSSVWEAPDQPSRRLPPPSKSWVSRLSLVRAVFTHTPNWVSLPNRKVGLFRPNGKFVPFEKLAPKDIRRNMVTSQAAYTSSKDHPRLNRPPKDWLAIWSLPFATPAITIWWRLLHSKIPSRHHLRKHGRPLKDDYCLFCPLVPETDFHLLITCPAKNAIWSCALPDSDTAEIQLNTLYFSLTTSFPYFNKTLLYLSIASQHDKLLHFSTACYYRSSVDILI